MLLSSSTLKFLPKLTLSQLSMLLGPLLSMKKWGQLVSYASAPPAPPPGTAESEWWAFQPSRDSPFAGGGVGGWGRGSKLTLAQERVAPENPNSIQGMGEGGSRFTFSTQLLPSAFSWETEGIL